MADDVDRLDDLPWSTLPLLSCVPPEERPWILSRIRRRRYTKDEVVFRAGDPADSLHVIVAGLFAPRFETELGERAMLAVFGPGDIVGEVSLAIPGRYYSGTFVSLGTGETLAIDINDVLALRSRQPSVADALLASMGAKILMLAAQLLEGRFVPAETRVTHRLLEISHYVPDGTEIGLTQQALAELAGTSRSTVNRVLRQEARRGTISIARGSVCVLNSEALADRSTERTVVRQTVPLPIIG